MPQDRDSVYEALLKTHLKNIPLRKGVVTVIEVRHDSHCLAPEGGDCCCTPDIVSGPAIQRKHGVEP